MAYHHGVKVIEINEGIRPIRTISTAVIGVVCTADDADDKFFPLDTPVLITDVYEALSKAGTRGTLAKTLDAIAEQARPVVIVIRVESAATEDEQTAKVIGTVNDSGKKTGLKALMAAESRFGVKPRILAAPGLDNQAVANELASISQKLRAMSYVSCWGCETKEDAALYRRNFGQRELFLIWPDVMNFDERLAKKDLAAATAYAVGLRAKIDQEQGWAKTLSNVELNGILGISKDVSFDLQNPDTDAGYLNSNDVTTLINRQGFKFWGSRTCSSDPLFAFESYTRTAQVLADTLGEAFMWAMDKKFHVTLARDILETLRSKGQKITTAGNLLGFSAWIDERFNTKESLGVGQLVIDYDYTPVPPLENLTLQQRITGKYLIDFVKKVYKQTEQKAG